MITQGIERIYLIGFMGTGKSTIGRLLAEQLHFAFVDSDTEIEESAKMSIKDIFAQSGESYFRDIESTILKELSETRRNVVIATGGGIILREDNRQMMKKNELKDIVIHLTASVSTLVERLAADQSRPLLAGDAKNKIEKLQRERNGLYDFADLTISTEAKTQEELVQEICNILKVSLR